MKTALMKKGGIRGISLVEILIVIAVIAVISAIGIPMLQNMSDRSIEAKNRNNAQNIANVAEIASTAGSPAILGAIDKENAISLIRQGVFGNGDFADVIFQVNIEPAEAVNAAAFLQFENGKLLYVNN